MKSGISITAPPLAIDASESAVMDIHVAASLYNLSEGEIVFHKPLELHKFRVISDAGLSVFVFSFDMSGANASFFKDKVFSLSDGQRSLIGELVEFVRASLPFPYGVRPDYVPHTASPLYLQTVSSYLTSLFLSLLNKQSISRPDESFDAKIFKLSVEFMKSNISRALSVDELALKVHVSKTALKEIFSRYGGMGVHKYFLKMKLSRASKLLKRGESVTDVAGELGFSSQAYFSSAFKRELGISPLEYARRE